MSNLVDIPVVVSTLVAFLATGGADAGIEFFKGITVNGAIKLNQLKDELIVQPAVNQALEQYQQDLSNVEAKQTLEAKLTEALENHPVFGGSGVYTAGNVKTKIKVGKGGVGVGINNDEIKVKNTFR